MTTGGYDSFVFQPGQLDALKLIVPTANTLEEAIAVFDDEINAHIDHMLASSGERFALVLTGALENTVLLAALVARGIKPDCYTVGTPEASDVYYAKIAAERYDVPWHYIEYDQELVRDSLPDILRILQFPCHFTVGSAILTNFYLQFARSHQHEHIWAGNGLNVLFGGGMQRDDYQVTETETFHEAFWNMHFPELEYHYGWPDPVNMYGRLGEHYGIRFWMPWERYEPITTTRKVNADLLYQQNYDLFALREWASQRLALPKELAYRPKAHLQETAGILEHLRSQMYAEAPTLLPSHGFYPELPEEDPDLEVRLWLRLRHEMQQNQTPLPPLA